MTVLHFLAPPDSILGQLQRGRGEGYRRVLLLPKEEAHRLLFSCIIVEPEFDPHGSKNKFYTTLAIEMDFPLEPLTDHLKRHDSESENSLASPVVHVLIEMAERNYKNSREILFDYLDWGIQWHLPLWALVELSEESIALRCAQAIERHFPNDDKLDDAVGGGFTDTFEKLVPHSSRIKAAIARMPGKQDRVLPSLPDFDSISIADLFEWIDQAGPIRWNATIKLRQTIRTIVKPNDLEFLLSKISADQPDVADIALLGLKQLAPPSIFDRLIELWLTMPEHFFDLNGYPNPSDYSRPGVREAVLALPGQTTLPVARNWIFDKDNRKKELAEDILEKHATEEDLPILRLLASQVLTHEQALTDDNNDSWCRSILKAFCRLTANDFMPELTGIFYQTRFSFNRCYAAQAIQATTPDFFRANLALECLWDSHSDTRILGITRVSIDCDEARQRIERMANDPFEEEDVRAKAQTRLRTASDINWDKRLRS